MGTGQVAQLKGSIVAGYARFLREHGEFDAVKAQLAPETAALLDAPPLAISWVDTVHARDVLNAVERLYGLDEVRRLGASSMSEGLMRLLRPMLLGLVRVAGASPHAIFGQLDSAARVAVRGYTVRYRETGPTAGALELRSHGIADSRAGLVGGWETALGSLLALASAKGTVHLHHHEMQGEDTVSMFNIRWEPRRG